MLLFSVFNSIEMHIYCVLGGKRSENIAVENQLFRKEGRQRECPTVSVDNLLEKIVGVEVLLTTSCL